MVVYNCFLVSGLQYVCIPFIQLHGECKDEKAQTRFADVENVGLPPVFMALKPRWNRIEKNNVLPQPESKAVRCDMEDRDL